jgi:hypothetical protein
MKTKLKTIIQKTYMKVRYQWWKAKIFAAPNDSRISKLVSDQIFHEDLMKATIALLDRLSPEEAKKDHNPYKFIGVLKADWMDAKPAEKDKSMSDNS